MKFKRYLQESRNTLLADINEILLGLYMVDGDWKKYDDAVSSKKQLEIRSSQISPEDYEIQKLRAEDMANAVKSWAAQNGYTGYIKRAWWTARPNVLSKAVGQSVDSRKNPTDTLVQFSDGKFLGLSAKSTKGKGDIGFKNPGLGTMQKIFKMDLSKVEKLENDAVKTLELPTSKNARKKYIRDNPDIQEKTIEIGKQILSVLRLEMFNALNKLNKKQLADHIVNNWMDAEVQYPPYIKVTGHGNKAGSITSSILDPLKNDKVTMLYNKQINLEMIGNDSIGVSVGREGKRIMKMRFKYESEKLASSIKLSGDPW